VSLDEYYERLGLPRAATPADIKRAYRRLRAKYHPDRNKGDESTAEPAFKRVQEAFEILTGKREAPRSPAPSKAGARAAEPRQRSHTRADSGRQPSGARAQEETTARAARPDSGAASAFAFAAHAGPMPVRGAHRHTQLYVPLEVAIHGGEVPASYQITATCRQCNGMSAPHMAQPCTPCGGLGRLHDSTVCTVCSGRGRVRSSPWCTACQNKGVELLPKSDTVDVPAGAWDGQRIVVTGGGFPGLHGGAAGDAIFTIAILYGTDIQRDGLNLIGEIEVDFVTATLGGITVLPFLGREIEVTIAPNAQSGSIVRLPAYGLTDPAGNRGELKLRIVLAMPAAARHLTEDQRQALREMFAEAERRGAAAR
jgi:molecular chaperone DnaJ